MFPSALQKISEYRLEIKSMPEEKTAPAPVRAAPLAQKREPALSRSCSRRTARPSNAGNVDVPAGF
jgi:hypothetical protein